MRAFIVAFALLAAGCHANVQRVYVLNPAEAAQYRYRSTVLAIRRGDSDIPVSNGSLAYDGVTAKVRSFEDIPMYVAHEEVLRPTDRVKMRVYYHDGDHIRGEGVVRKSDSDGSGGLVGGLFLAGMGAALFALGVDLALEPCPPPPPFDFNTWWRNNESSCNNVVVGGTVMVIGGAATITGVVLAVALGRPKSPRLNVVPALARAGGGASLQIRF